MLAGGHFARRSDLTVFALAFQYSIHCISRVMWLYQPVPGFGPVRGLVCFMLDASNSRKRTKLLHGYGGETGSLKDAAKTCE
jgi:hypothetical protein